MLGDNIKKYRKENNMSQDELAEKLDVTRQSVSLWENGQTQPSLDNIIALAKLFNISTDVLLGNGGADAAPVPEEKGAEEAPAPGSRKSKLPMICLLLVLVLLAAGIFWVITKGNLALPFGNQKEAQTSAATKTADNTKNKTAASAAQKTAQSTSKPTASATSKTAQPKKSVENKTVQSSTGSTVVSQAKAQQPKKQAEVKDLYSILKDYAVKNGILKGDYSAYSKPADTYGGNPEDDFSLYYWGDTDTVEFCLHRVIDDTYSINFYLRVPKVNNGTYEYISSYYYRGNGEAECEAKGTVQAAEFTDSYPLRCSKYTGDSDVQNDFMETSRKGVCETIVCLKEFVGVEETGCTFADFGFKNF